MHEKNLEEWFRLLHSDVSERAFGRGFRIKIDLMAQLIDGDVDLPAIAARHGVSERNVYKHMRRLREAYDFNEQKVQI